MCLNGILTQKNKKTWMEEKPETITAYKVVRIIDGKVYPMYFKTNIPFEKTNKLLKKESKDRIETGGVSFSSSTYRPYYHLFTNKKEAERWSSNGVALRCKVPKNQITVVGTQLRKEVIIAKEFIFVQGDEYFKEEK